MNKLSSRTRIALALTMFSTSVLLCLRLANLFNDGHHLQLAARTRLCESAAVSCSEFASRGMPDGIEVVLAGLVARNENVVSAGYRTNDDEMQFVSGPHDASWSPTEISGANNCIFVPIYTGNEQAGRIEVSFESLAGSGVAGFLSLPSIRTIVLATVCNLIGFAFCLSHCFRFLDPNRVVPDRVRGAFDNMAEGILVLDRQKRIVLANQSISAAFETTSAALQGKQVTDLSWESSDQAHEQRLPWDSGDSVDDNGGELPKVTVRSESGTRSFLVNSAPILHENGEEVGSLISLNDVTAVDAKNRELQLAMQDLEQSQAEIKNQNKQLQFLATRDPLTSCLNRRSFFESYGEQWKQSQRYGFTMAIIMVDIDYFKAINDNHGHAKGDEVLKGVAAALIQTSRETDYVCRYGGEEFCVLLPHINIDQACIAAERLGDAIRELDFAGLKVTASLGVSSTQFEAADQEALIDQADKALYAAKRGGRNRYVRFDDVPAEMEVDESKISRCPEANAAESSDETVDAEVIETLQELVQQVSRSLASQSCNAETVDGFRTRLANLKATIGTK
ncbi:MAG: sensor domain-containing diguanylate cyclase [Planctomycetota bacterium]